MFFGARKVGQLALSLFLPFSAPNKIIWALFGQFFAFGGFQVSLVLGALSLHEPEGGLEVVRLKK